MKRIILCFLYFFLISLSYADSSDHFNWKDNTGYFEVDIKKQCDNYIFEYEKFKKMAEDSCKQKDMPLKNYDAEFLVNCKVAYTFTCDYAPSKRRQEIEKKDRLEQEQKNAEAKKLKDDNEKKEKRDKVEKAKMQCLDIGYKTETDKFKDCVLELLK
jgi:hypothetical protein